MSNYQESSREAYNLVKPTLAQSRARVLEAIKNIQPCSDKQICSYLGLLHNQVAPRRFELEKMGLIYSEGKQKNENGISVLMWKILTK